MSVCFDGSGLGVVISPYDLVSPGAAVRAALLLASDAATLTPFDTSSGGSGTNRLARAASAALLQKWEWTEALWRDGTLHGGGDDGPGERIGAVLERLDSDPALARLRELIEARAERTGRSDRVASRMSVDEICRDVLRGGAEPEATVAVGAALEQWGAERGRALVRGEAKSITAMLESGETSAVMKFNAPVIGGDGEVIARAREMLRDPLGLLRAALTDELSRHSRRERASDAGSTPEPLSTKRVQEASRALCEAFSAHKRVLWSLADEFGCSRSLSLASVSIGVARVDSALRAAARVADRSLSGGPASAGASSRAGASSVGHSRESKELAVAGDVRSMFVLSARLLPWEV